MKNLDAICEASPADIEAALQAAENAFPVYRQYSGAQRADFLERIGAEIMALGEALIECCQAETGLPAARLEGERARTVGQLKMFADLIRDGSWVEVRIDQALPDRKPQPRPDLRRTLIPLGPVAVFGASNFPLAFSVAGGDTASALAAGCPVVVKAHEAHPGTSAMVAGAVHKALQECGMPAGVFTILSGSGPVVGIALVKHPLTRAVGFTGSLKAGRALFDAAVARPVPIPVFAEMSSSNPVFLLPGSVRERAADLAAGLTASFTLGVGQFCTKPGLVFGVASAELTHLENFLKEKVAATAPAPMLHSGIAKSFHAGVESATKLSGVTVLARGPAGDTTTQGGPVVLQTDVANFLRQPQLAEEIFGPVTLLVTAQSLTELEAAARMLDGQLTATIHGTEEDLRAATQLVRVLEQKAGRLVCNGFPTGVEVCAAMQHGGPYPATTDSRFTSVGTAAILRWVRPICYQNWPVDLLPEEVRS